MSPSNPIGVFDSGIGGLSVLKKIRELMPSENLIYLADSAYVPYGNKSELEIRERAELISQYFIEQHQVKAIVIACNTATAAAVNYLRGRLSLPILGMEPAVKPAVEQSLTGAVGILATENTLKSEKFSDLVNQFGRQAIVVTQQCSGLVEQIELGDFSSPELRNLVEQYISPLLAKGVDSIVLGCTHYPFIRTVIEELVGDSIRVIETGDAVARHLHSRLSQLSLLNPCTVQGKIDGYTSGENTRPEYYSKFWNGQIPFQRIQFEYA